MRSNMKAQRMPEVRPQPMPAAVADGGPLVRLGEGIVVDWNDEAWDMVFGGSEPSHGARTFLDLEMVNDPALKIKQRKRKSRRTRGITLDECLDEFERAEVLSEQDMWYCPRCKEHRRATKKFDLWKTPDYLVAHLKRFSSSGYRREKLDVLVDFPIEGLDITSRVLQKEDGKDEIYDLVAVDDHWGGLGGGHYTAYAKNFVDGRWYNYNDSSASPVSDPQSAVTSAAYLLFYRRRSKGPLGGPRCAEIIEKYNNVDEDDAEEVGEDQRLGGGSSLNGSSDAGRGVAAARPLDRGSALTRTRAAADDDDDDDPPSYEAAQGQDIRRSVEDEGIDMLGQYQPNTMAQTWSFDRLEDSGPEGFNGGDTASNDAQLDSSADERDAGDGFFDQETDTAMNSTPGDFLDAEAPLVPDDRTQVALSDIQTEAWERKGVVSVPPVAGSDGASDEVAEIHLEK
jgi:ubiquitin carboxyl-terminal hydrolase 4/11/15